jgi:DHA1 family inner membrane transport protein
MHATTNGSLRAKYPLAIYILSLSVFAIGTSEFAPMGLLTEVAQDLSIPIPSAGWIITGYALGAAVGGPIMALLTARLPRKVSLLLLIALFAAGNAISASSGSYDGLLIARVITSFGHGAFFGIAAVLAAGLVSEEYRGGAIALMFGGLTVASVLGVPLGTLLGQWAGWRAPFWAITSLAIIAMISIAATMPKRHDEEHINILGELRALGDFRIWVALGTTVTFNTAVFVLFAFVSPLLEDVTGVTPGGLTISLLLIGLSMAVGTQLGGRLADWNVGRALVLIGLALGAVSLLLWWTGHYLILGEVNWMLWGVVAFAPIAGAQLNVMRFGTLAPNLVSTLNISAFNIGVALGSWIGSLLLISGFGLENLPLAAAVLSLIAALASHTSGRLDAS